MRRRSGPINAYTFAVEVFVPQLLGEVITNTVTDPYSVGLTLNSQHSVVLDLERPRWAPEVWTGHRRADVVEQFADQTIYVVHLRDFSAGDEALPDEVRGSYVALRRPRLRLYRTPGGARRGRRDHHALDADLRHRDHRGGLLRADQPEIPADADSSSVRSSRMLFTDVAGQDAYTGAMTRCTT